MPSENHQSRIGWLRASVVQQLLAPTLGVLRSWSRVKGFSLRVYRGCLPRV